MNSRIKENMFSLCELMSGTCKSHTNTNLYFYKKLSIPRQSVINLKA